jgi:hypothetical protein
VIPCSKAELGNLTMLTPLPVCLHLKVTFNKKKSLDECKQQPNSHSKTMKNRPVSKYFSFIAGVLDTGD